MKTLFLLRHAKAFLYSANNSDKDRPVTVDGKRDAEIIAEILLKNKELPQQIISSPALRAITTAKIVAKNINYPEKEIIIDKNIYEASSRKLQAIIEKTNNNIDSLMLVGHNPGISDLINDIADSNFDFLPTSGLVCLKNISDSWDKIYENWKIKYIENPSKH